MAELVSKTLNNQYYLRRLVGSGGMADVYEAFDKVRATNMAVKVLRRDVASNSRFYQAFEKEATILRELQHPNIVRLYEFGRDGEIVFIVMAWVDGSDLKQKLMHHSDAFSLVEVSAVLKPVASALNFAHQIHVYHCDIKPANILLQNDGKEVLLTDFGVAQLASECTARAQNPAQGRSRSGSYRISQSLRLMLSFQHSLR
jgi:serine/threonine-protein kinase